MTMDMEKVMAEFNERLAKQEERLAKQEERLAKQDESLAQQHKINATLEKGISVLQERFGGADGQRLAYELAEQVRILDDPNSEAGFRHSNLRWTNLSAQQQQPVVSVLSVVPALAKDASQFAALITTLQGDRDNACHFYQLECLIQAVHTYKEHNLMPALKRVDFFAHELLSSADVLVRTELGPARAVQLACLALRFAKVKLWAGDHKSWTWSQWHKDMGSGVAQFIAELLTKDEAFGSNSYSYAYDADELENKVRRLGPKLPNIQLSSAAASSSLCNITVAELQQATQLSFTELFQEEMVEKVDKFALAVLTHVVPNLEIHPAGDPGHVT